MKPIQRIITDCLYANHFIAAAMVGIIILFASCTPTKNSTYFKTLQKDETLKGFVNKTYESKIIVGDKLSINAQSLSSVEDALFNGINGGASGAAQAVGGYTVQPDGNVLLRRLGLVQAVGLTRKEFAQKIQTALLDYMKEPIVTVNYLNHKVTILGEVSTPQVLSLNEERISLIDALVLSGDVTANADRSKITVIREDGSEKIIKSINLEDNSIFTSDWYYVQPNDIIIVSADKEKLNKEESKRNLQGTLALVASGISLLIIIADRVIK